MSESNCKHSPGTLPLYPYAATQAVNCLCPLLAMGYSESTARGKTFVVTGGHGSLAPFVVQILKAWGGSVCCVTTRSEG